MPSQPTSPQMTARASQSIELMREKIAQTFGTGGQVGEQTKKEKTDQVESIYDDDGDDDE